METLIFSIDFMQFFRLFIFQTLAVAVKCGWELFLSELNEVSISNSNWKYSATNAPVVQFPCTITSNLYIANGDQNMKRTVTLPANRPFQKVRIMFDLYFIYNWSSNQITIFVNNIVKKTITATPQVSTLDTTKHICFRDGIGEGYDTLHQITIEETFTDQTLIIEIQSNKIASQTFGLSNFQMYVEYNSIDHCEIQEGNQCTKCEGQFTVDTTGQSCSCTTVFDQKPISHLFRYYGSTQLQCLETCPPGYSSNQDNICYPTAASIIFEDLKSPSFSTYLFEYLPDTKRSSPGNKIMTIDGLNVAGPFIAQDALKYSTTAITAGQAIKLSFRLYVVSQTLALSCKYTCGIVKVKLNDYYFTDLSIYSFDFLINVDGLVLSRDKCTLPSAKQCWYYDLQFILYASEAIQTITFLGFFDNYNHKQYWAIRNFQISSPTFGPITKPCAAPCSQCLDQNWRYCTACSSGLLAYEGRCLNQCPQFTTVSAGKCIDPEITSNTGYAINVGYDLHFFDNSKLISEINGLGAEKSQFQSVYRGKYLMLGGFKIWESSQQLVFQLNNLPPFYEAKVKLSIVFIDNFNNDGNFELGIENDPIQLYSPSFFTLVNNQLGLQDPEYEGVITQTHSEVLSLTSLKVVMRCAKQTVTNPNLACGVYNFRVYIKKCPSGCLQCNNADVCLTPLDTPTQNQFGCKPGYYFNSDEGTCSSCASGCISCTAQNSCLACRPTHTLFSGKCYCADNKLNLDSCNITTCHDSCSTCSQLSPGGNSCLSCNSSLHRELNISNCVCEDGYYEEKDFLCWKCFPTCKTCVKSPRLCLSCDPAQKRHLAYQGCECDDGYFQNDTDTVCAVCDPICKTCRLTKTICTSCKPDQHRTLSSNRCICAPGYYEIGDLSCTRCPDICATCSNAETCLSCNPFQFRQLSIFGVKCVCQAGFYEVAGSNICGCKILLLLLIACHVSCSACASDPKPDQCTRCPQTRAPKNSGAKFQCVCRRGYYENGQRECLDCRNFVSPPPSHYCYSQCGDGVVQWNEDCDDGNSNPRDGCTNCLDSNSPCLDSTCLACHASLCTQCVDGYFLGNDGKCHVCDSICKKCVTRADNCTQCTLLQPNGKSCVLCTASRGYRIVQNTCENICGDGIKVPGEECDDGNSKEGDGCSKSCKVEAGWLCDQSCEKIKYPAMVLTEDELDGIYDPTRRVQFIIDQLVKGQSSLAASAVYAINDVVFVPNIIDQTDYVNLYTTISIKYQFSLNESAASPTFKLTLPNPHEIVNEKNFPLQESSASLVLLEYKPQTEGVKAATDGLMGLNQYILYLLLGLALLAFLFGGLNIFWNLLDSLQLICYLKYFNLVYPYNVEQYFTLFGFAEFDFLKQYLDLESLMSKFVDTPDADAKFHQEGYSSVFFVNIIAVTIVFVTTFLSFLACKLLFYLLRRFAATLTKDAIDECEQSVFQFFIYRVTRNLEKSLLKITSEFNSALLRTFMAVAFDYNIAIFLQLKDIRTQNPILCLSALFSAAALILEAVFLFKGFCFMAQPKYFFKSLSTLYNYGSLFEGLKLENNPFTYHFNILLLGKKMAFMFFLVMLYSNPCLQIGLVSLLNAVFFVYLLRVRPLEEGDEQFKSSVSEILLCFAELLILSLAALGQLISDDQELIIGWFIIIMCSSLILFQLVMDVKQHANFLMKEYKIISKLMDRLRLFLNRQEPEQEGNIFLKHQRDVLGSRKKSSKSQLRMRKVVTFSLSSSSS